MQEEKAIQAVHKMAETPVKRLMLTMSIPMILSMALQAMYNIVDSAFVSNMAENGEEALNALTLAFPIQMLMVAVAIGTGVGANALVAKCLGKGDREKASKTAGNAIFLGIVIFVLFALFGLFGVKGYIASQTDNALIFDMAVIYLKICCIASFGIVFFSVFEKLLQATGRSVHSTIAQISGAAVNIILDPILIYGLLGAPRLGVTGAAAATVIGQVVSWLLAMLFHFVCSRELDKNIRAILPNLKIIGGIYKIGLPAIIAQALTSVMTYSLNIIFVRIDESVVTAYGLYYKIQQFVLFAAFGLRDAITPILSFAHGMGSRERIYEGKKHAMLYTFLIMAAGLAVIECFARPLTGLFGLSGVTEKYCLDAMHIVSASFVFAGANIAYQGIFQALDSGTESLVISVCRQFLFVVPVAWLFAWIASTDYSLVWIIWLTFPIAELLTAAIAFMLMRSIEKRKLCGNADA